MLEPEEVTLAVELQQKTYGLLQWIADAVRKGTLTFGTAHGYATAADSLRAIPGNVDCYCEFCRRLVTASHLKARKVGSPEKARARALKQKYLEDLACELGKAVTESTARALIEGAETAEVVALSTYGASLVRRCQGDPGEPALLALWREFAWSTGSPRRDFRLSGEAILAAEQIVVEHLGA